jgi:hypothetical protein
VTSNDVTSLSAEDRLGIMELYARQAWAMDSNDTEAFVAQFAPDAVAYGENRVQDLPKFLADFHGDSGFPGSQHFVSQMRFLEGDDTWHKTRAYVIRIHRQPGSWAVRILYQGFYHDTVVKRDGKWVFQSKQAGPAEKVLEQAFTNSPGWNADTKAWQIWDLGAQRVI